MNGETSRDDLVKRSQVSSLGLYITLIRSVDVFIAHSRFHFHEVSDNVESFPPRLCHWATYHVQPTYRQQLAFTQGKVNKEQKHGNITVSLCNKT